MYLSDLRHVSPIDPNGEWFDEQLAEAAETFYRRKVGSAYNPGPKPAPFVVRDDWRKIRAPDLTDAEHELFTREIGPIAEKIRKLLAKAAEAMRARARPKAPAATTITQPFALPAEDDPAVQRILNDIERHTP